MKNKAGNWGIKHHLCHFNNCYVAPIVRHSANVSIIARGHIITLSGAYASHPITHNIFIWAINSQAVTTAHYV